MFNHTDYINKYTQNPKNDATAYGVTVDRAQVQEGETYFQVIGIWHLLPSENRGNRNIFLDVLDENNQRIRGTLIDWTWEGRRPDEPANPAVVDKPDNEPGGNISVGAGQKISLRVLNARSDRVNNLHSLHPDERGPNGELWNSIGHHSFYIIFKRIKKGSSVPPPPLNGEEPGNGGNNPPPEEFIKTFVIYEDDQIKVTQTIRLK